MASDTPREQIAICIASFNRREKTLACLERLESVRLPDGLSLAGYLLDDASTDGTADAVRTRFPWVEILTGTGSLFWAGGMRVAFGAALAHPHPYFVWLNDDVLPREDSLETLINVERALFAEEGRHHLVSGGMWDRSADQPSYGGYNLVHRRWNPSKIEMVLPDPAVPRACDLLNANMLLIPAEIARALGNIPAGYDHTLGDWDLSLRASSNGYGTTLAPGYVGECSANIPWRRRWFGPGLSLRERYRRMLHPLALPFKARAVYLFRHFPLVAPLFLFSPYLKLPFDHLRGRLSKAP